MVADHERPTPRPHLARRRQARLLVYASQTRLASTRLERTFDPAFIQRLKDAATADISIGGPHLAADAIRAGLVDEYWVLICPIMVGGGTPFLPDGVRVPLELLAKREFGGGEVYLRYAVSL